MIYPQEMRCSLPLNYSFLLNHDLIHFRINLISNQNLKHQPQGVIHWSIKNQRNCFLKYEVLHKPLLKVCKYSIITNLSSIIPTYTAVYQESYFYLTATLYNFHNTRNAEQYRIEICKWLPLSIDLGGLYGGEETMIRYKWE